MKYIDRRKEQIQGAIREEHDQEDWNEVHSQLLAIQKKSLEVSDPNDADEKEADAVARKVSDGESAEIHGTGGTINRKGEGAAETTSEFNSKLDSSKGGGKSLDGSTKNEMESKMGADFGGVKIHTGSEANEMKESVNAKAFTHGQDIYFGEGNYDAESKEGKELLAHELVHTVQQGGDVKRGIDRKEYNAPKPPHIITVPFLPVTQVEILDLNGKRVAFGELNGKSSFTFDGTGSSAVYVVVATDKNGNVTKGTILELPSESSQKITISFETGKKEETNDLSFQNHQNRIKHIYAGFKLIIDKYGMKDAIFGMQDEELNSTEKLLTNIESWILFGDGYPTALLWNGLRYDAWDGINRLVIIDAPDDFERTPHMFAFDFNGKGLKFTYFRLAEPDEAMRNFKAKTSNTNAHVPTLITPHTSSKENDRVSENTSQTGTQTKQTTAIPVISGVPSGSKPTINKAGNVIYEPDHIDSSLLATFGINVSLLKMEYQELSGALESRGGCRYKVTYNGVFMGYFEMHRIDNNMRFGDEVGEFKKAYAESKGPFYNAIITGKLWRFAVDADADSGGDPDFILLMLRGGFPNSNFDGMSNTMLLSGAIADAGGAAELVAGGLKLVQVLMEASGGGVKTGGRKGNVNVKAPEGEKAAEKLSQLELKSLNRSTLNVGNEISPQKQARHLPGNLQGYLSILKSIEEAQAILTDYHAGKGDIVNIPAPNQSGYNRVIVKFPDNSHIGTWGTKTQSGEIISVPSNTFMIEGSGNSVKIYPVNPVKY